jgi:hypothetical protein
MNFGEMSVNLKAAVSDQPSAVSSELLGGIVA